MGRRKNERKTGREKDSEEASVTVNTISLSEREPPCVFRTLSEKVSGEMAALEAGTPDQRKVIPEQDKLLPFHFWSLILLRSKFMVVCQFVPIGIGSSVPNWWVWWALGVHKLYISENKFII